MFKQFPNESYRPTAETVDGILANVTNNQLGPGFATYDVRDLASLSHAEHPKPYLVTVRDDPAQVIKDLVRNCYTIPGMQTYAKYAKEVVDARGVRYISEPWTADLWLETQVRKDAPVWQALAHARPLDTFLAALTQHTLRHCQWRTQVVHAMQCFWLQPRQM